MNYKAKKVITNWRVILVFAVVFLSLIAIHPNPTVEGVAIRNIVTNSSASSGGMQSPLPTVSPMSRERIISMNNRPIESEEDYFSFSSSLGVNRTVQIKTNKGKYIVVTRPEIKINVLNETEEVIVEEIIQENVTIDNETVLVNKTINKTVTRNKIETEVVGVEDLGINVYEAPKNNIRKGLDLQGGTRVLLQPEKKLSENDLEILIENLKYRLNVYGLTDIVVRDAGDLSGNQYILIEIAGAKEDEAQELMSKQGKFEAKIGEGVVFKGGSDIVYVCRSADCSGIDPQSGCGATKSGWACRFRFAISLSPEAAEKQAELTQDLEVITTDSEGYLSEKLSLFLDDTQVDELNIGEDLKGRADTEIQISGSGVGATQQEAIENSLKNMKRLQTILITGSLPVKLNIVKTDSISPILGEEFIKSSLLIGLIAILAVSIIAYVRYRKLTVSITMLCTLIVEVVIILGIASLIGWNIDLAAIAGIIIAIGTGVDHQIVITDETLKGQTGQIFDWKKRIKNAFFIIMAAYFTTMVAMIPLIFAGAGLLKGFAITTIIGISIGVFISRPAYASIIEILLKE